VSERPARGGDRPNVVLVVLDTARADALEPYGAAPGSSPVVADLARRGTALRDVFSTANWTFPSHVSMFTGRLPREVDLYRPTGDAATRMAALEPRLLPAVLRAAGYATKAVSANPWVHPTRGFDVGFDEFVAVQGTHRNSGFNAGAGPDRGPFPRRIRAAVPRTVDAVRARADHGAAESAEVVRRWAATIDRSRPFFWFVNLLECHSPYAPPRKFARLGALDRVRAAFDHEHVNGLLSLWAINSGATSVRSDRIDRMRRAYPGGVLAADDWVGRLLDELATAGVLDDTVVVVTSDHGENLGESGRIAHALWLDDRLIRVPLVVAGPTQRDVAGTTSLAGLPRLVADAIGLDDHPWRDAREPGIGVAQFDPPVPLSDPRFGELREQLRLDDYAVWRLTTPSTCATDGRLKLVIEGAEEWAYDLAADPAEEHPVHVDGRTALRYGERLRLLRRVARAARPRADVAHRATTAVDVGDRAGAAVDDDMAARLRLLGYM
jgi:arylsulfatase A-like enzyme